MVKFRLCLDFRAVSKTLLGDRYSLTNITTILNQLGERKLFSGLDFKQGYHQIPLDDKSKEKTAFTFPDGD